MSHTNPITSEAVSLAYAIQGMGKDYPEPARRLANLVIQLHAPRETVTMPTQDGLVLRHGQLKARPPMPAPAPTAKPPKKAARRPKAIKKAGR